MSGRRRGRSLPVASSVLAVCAHPDDESFGLGAVLHHFVANGADVAMLCFTRGEASSLWPMGTAATISLPLPVPPSRSFHPRRPPTAPPPYD